MVRENPSLFLAPLEDVIISHGLHCMMNADDMQLHVFVNPVEDRSVVVSKLETCAMDIFVWRNKNGLDCYPYKTEVTHLKNSKKFSLAVAELHIDSEMFNAIRTGEIQVVYAAAEQVLNEKFTSMLKEDCPFKTLNMGGAVDEFFTTQ